MTADVRLAAALASAAGELLLDIRRSSGKSGHDLGDEGDARANELIVERLRDERPDDAVLSEESADDKRRSSADRVWIVDPLDGTREYRTDGRHDWAVHVALWHRGSGLVAGAVALPALGVVYDSATAVAPDVGLLPEPSPGSRPRLVVSGSRPPDFADRVADAIGVQVTALGSAGAKTMAVLRGEALAYVHAGGQYEWDSAAPVAVAQAAGLHCSRIDGAELTYNHDDVYLPDLIVCRPDDAAAIIDAVAATPGNPPRNR